MTNPLFRTWVSTPTLHNLHRNLQILKYEKQNETLSAEKELVYRAKIKIHGTHAAIVVTRDNVYALSRNKLCTPEDDNCGFAKWVESIKESLLNREFVKGLCRNQVFIIRGEWAGPGVANGASAYHKLKDKFFAVYAIQDIRFIDLPIENQLSFIYCEPEKIKALLELEIEPLKRVYVLPWHLGTDQTVLTFSVKHLDENGRSKPLDELTSELINNEIAQIDKQDPWALETFNVSGTGEGLVFYPSLPNRDNRDGRFSNAEFETYIFKAKGDTHKLTSTGKAVSTHASTSTSDYEFVKLVLTNARLLQALDETKAKDIKDIRNFLKWIQEDILKEAQGELNAIANGSTKTALKRVADEAAMWYKKHINYSEN